MVVVLGTVMTRDETWPNLRAISALTTLPAVGGGNNTDK